MSQSFATSKIFKLRAQRFLEPDDHFFFEEIDDADEIIFAAERELQRHRMSAQALANGAHDVIEIRAHAVHLVDEANARNVVLVRLAPYRFRLRLHAGDGVEHADRAVQHAQRALHFHGEIHVAGRIDDVDPILLAERASNWRWSRREVMVMPRSRSCSIQSIVAVPSSTEPIL